MGTVANWQQHLLPNLLIKPGEELAGILGEELPQEANPLPSYDGPPRMIVPTVRTSLSPGEDLRLKVILLGPGEPENARLQWRPLGKGEFESVPLEHVARGVYAVRIAADRIGDNDIEYSLQASLGATSLRFPATAPATNQTVVIVR